MKKPPLIKNKLIITQLALVLPLVLIFGFFTIYLIYENQSSELDLSRKHIVETVAEQFNTEYLNIVQLLEKPYTNKLLYDNITKSNLYLNYINDSNLASILYQDIMYYSPTLAAVSLVSIPNQNFYYKHTPPAIGIQPSFSTYESITKSEWYQTTISQNEPYVYTTSPDEYYKNVGVTLSISQRLLNTQTYELIGAIKLDFNISKFMDPMSTIVQSSNDCLILLDSNQKMIYSSNPIIYDNIPLLNNATLQDFQDNYYTHAYTHPNNKITFIYLTDKSSAMYDSEQLRNFVLFLMFLVLLFTTMYIFIVSNNISKPISILKNAMIQSKKNQFTTICPTLPYEFGVLSQTFNEMSETLNAQIADIKHAEQEKSKLKYNVIMSKINPHFLYNTLNTIKWRADVQGCHDVGDSLEKLSALLRFSIKYDNDLIDFETELKQLENYIDIMRIRYENDIDIDFDIDDACYKYYCPKLLIQPFVENSYVHAFQGKNITNKLILISVSCKNEDYIEISICDNGIGMTQEAINNMLRIRVSSDKDLITGIGISNTNLRVKSLFGDNYGLNINSDINKCTKMTITVPKLPIESQHSEDT